MRFSEHLRQNFPLRTLEMAFQTIKIPINAHVIPQWLKLIPILHTQKVWQSANNFDFRLLLFPHIDNIS